MSRPAARAPAKALFTSAAARFYLVLLLLSLAYLVRSLMMGPPMIDGRLSPSFFPLLVGIGASALCLAQWLAEIRRPQGEGSEAGESTPTASEDSRGAGLVRQMARSPAIRLMVATSLYIAAFSILGYWLSSVLYVLTVMVLFAGRERMLSKAVIALVTTAIGYLMFSELFHVRLPLLWE